MDKENDGRVILYSQMIRLERKSKLDTIGTIFQKTALETSSLTNRDAHWRQFSYLYQLVDWANVQAGAQECGALGGSHEKTGGC